MDTLAMLVGGFSAILFYLAWREHANANSRDAKLIAGAAVCAGIVGAGAALL